MISNLRGILIFKSTNEAIIECGGVGYSVNISINTSDKLPELKKEVSLLTILIPREDSWNLFGFLSEGERDAFKLLTSVSGVGAKTSIGILSSVDIESLAGYLLSGNITALQKLPGIGKKTAERLVVELKDKVGKIRISGKIPSAGSTGAVWQEAIAALVALGYSQQTADKAVKKALGESTDKEQDIDYLIRKSLKYALNQ